MDPKRKKLYIAAIVICLAACVGVLWFGGIIGGSADPLESEPISVPVKTTPRPTSDGSYPPPTVFPDNPKLDMSVFDLSAFKSLNLYSSPALPQSEIGREDPFKTY